MYDFAQLREVLRRENEKQKNAGKQIVMNQNKNFVDAMEIDSFHMQDFSAPGNGFVSYTI